MKTRILTGILLLVGHAWAGETRADISKLLLKGKVTGDFEVCNFVEDVIPGRYAPVQYVYNDGMLRFALVLYRNDGGDAFKLFVYDGDTPRDALVLIGGGREPVSASGACEISVPLANEIYRAWAAVIFRARYGQNMTGNTSNQFYYVSAFSEETGPMAAMATLSGKPGEAIYKIAAVGKLLRRISLKERSLLDSNRDAIEVRGLLEAID